MANAHSAPKTVNVTIDTAGMTEAQVRLVRAINVLLEKVLKSEDEAEYFDSSAELMKTVASAVKQANFGSMLVAGGEGIEYTQQALEFSLDLLSETIYNNKVISYDN